MISKEEERLNNVNEKLNTELTEEEKASYEKLKSLLESNISGYKELLDSTRNKLYEETRENLNDTKMETLDVVVNLNFNLKKTKKNSKVRQCIVQYETYENIQKKELGEMLNKLIVTSEQEQVAEKLFFSRKSDYCKRELKTSKGKIYNAMWGKDKIENQDEIDAAYYLVSRGYDVVFLEDRKHIIDGKIPDLLVNGKYLFEIKTSNNGNATTIADKTIKGLKKGRVNCPILYLDKNDKARKISKKDIIGSIDKFLYKMSDTSFNKKSFVDNFFFALILRNDDIEVIKRGDIQLFSSGSNPRSIAKNSTISLENLFSSKIVSINDKNVKYETKENEENVKKLTDLSENEAKRIVSEAKKRGYIVPRRVGEIAGDVETMTQYAELDRYELLGASLQDKAKAVIDSIDLTEQQEERNLYDVAYEKWMAEYTDDNGNVSISEDTKKLMALALKLEMLETTAVKDKKFVQEFGSTKQGLMRLSNALKGKDRLTEDGKVITDVYSYDGIDKRLLNINEQTSWREIREIKKEIENNATEYREAYEEAVYNNFEKKECIEANFEYFLDELIKILEVNCNMKIC